MAVDTGEFGKLWYELPIPRNTKPLEEDAGPDEPGDPRIGEAAGKVVVTAVSSLDAFERRAGSILAMDGVLCDAPERLVPTAPPPRVR